MQRIQDFRWEKDDTPCIMHTRLVRFARESRGVFAESQLVNTFASDNRASTMSYDSLVSTGVAYLFDIAARPAREHRSIQLGVVRMVNNTNILVVSCIGGNTTRVAPRCVMMDSGT